MSKPPRVGLFGLLGSGNIGNDVSMESVLHYLRTAHPEAIVDVMCKGPQTVIDRYGVPAMFMNWYQPYEKTATGLRAILLKSLGKGIDVFRTSAWVRRHDVVIVPGMGTMEATLPLTSWGLPYSFFLTCTSAKIFGTKVAFVSIGAGLVKRRATGTLLDASAKLAATARTATSSRGTCCASVAWTRRVITSTPTWHSASRPWRAGRATRTS